MNTTHGEAVTLETTVKFQITQLQKRERRKKAEIDNYTCIPLLILLKLEKLVFALYNGGMN